LGKEGRITNQQPDNGQRHDFHPDRKVRGPPFPSFGLQEKEPLHQIRTLRLVVMVVITIVSVVIG
jgi:hypothetical protein